MAEPGTFLGVNHMALDRGLALDLPILSLILLDDIQEEYVTTLLEYFDLPMFLDIGQASFIQDPFTRNPLPLRMLGSRLGSVASHCRDPLPCLHTCHHNRVINRGVN